MAADGTAIHEKVVGNHFDNLHSYLRMDPDANRQVCDLHFVNIKVVHLGQQQKKVLK
jgi:hypothetical protein